MLQHNIWKELSKLVHVLALSALHKADPSYKTRTQLENYAFPLDIDLDDASVVFGDEK